jgi:hypothetical protein
MALVAIAFFFVFKKKKMTVMRFRLFLWVCSNEEGVVAFFYGGVVEKKKKMMIMNHCLLLWFCFNKKGDDNLLPSFFSMVVLQ